MKTSLFLVASLWFMACATQKNKTRNVTTETYKYQRSHLMNDTAALWAQRIQLTHVTENRLDIVDIVPQGTFRYHPDSGYTGTAETVTLRRFSTSDQALSDSLLVSETSATNRAEATGVRNQTRHEAIHDQLNRKPIGIPRYWWALLLIASLLLGGTWLYRKIRAKL